MALAVAGFPSSAACFSCCFCSVILTESLVNPCQVLLLGEYSKQVG